MVVFRVIIVEFVVFNFTNFVIIIFVCGDLGLSLMVIEFILSGFILVVLEVIIVLVYCFIYKLLNIDIL